MDDRQFDLLTKRLATSRRTFFKGALGLSGVAAIGRLATRDTEAARRGYNGPSSVSAPAIPTQICPKPGCCATCPTDYKILNQFAQCVVTTTQTCAQCAQAATGCQLS